MGPVGARPEDVGYLTSTIAMELDTLPDSMMVVGGNAVGLEMAQFFVRLGTQVTVIEALDRLAPFEDPEISVTIEEVFAAEGIAVHTGAALTAVRRDARGYTLTTGRGELRAERLLIVAGPPPRHRGAGAGRRRGVPQDRVNHFMNTQVRSCSRHFEAVQVFPLDVSRVRAAVVAGSVAAV